MLFYLVILIPPLCIKPGELIKDYIKVSGLSFRTDSDIEEKRQNAIEQVTKSHLC